MREVNSVNNILSAAKDKAFYSDNVNYFEYGGGPIIEHCRAIEQYVHAILPQIKALGSGIRMLEMGAGTCATTLTIRKFASVSEAFCLDISRSRMEICAPRTADLLGTDTNGMQFAEADISGPILLPDASFDLIVFDASLHHSRSIWTTLSEVRRLLRPRGAVACLREAYLAPFTGWYALRRLLRSPEFAAGVAENAYTKGQYDYYLRANGLNPQFIPVNYPRKFLMLAPLNGILFSKWSIWAIRDEDKV